MNLETERLFLRAFEPKDAEAVFEYASDPETTQHMAWNTLVELAEAESWVKGVVNTRSSTDLVCALTKKATPDRVVGAVSLVWREPQHKVMELGYILRRDCWGHGYMPEAARALMISAFDNTDVERIFAPIYADNTQSRRAAEKMGMTLDGILRSARLLRGRRRDECIFSVLRAEI